MRLCILGYCGFSEIELIGGCQWCTHLGYAKTLYSHPGISYLGSTRCGLASNLSFREWGCCLGIVSAQRAIIPVEDEKPNLIGASVLGQLNGLSTMSPWGS